MKNEIFIGSVEELEIWLTKHDVQFETWGFNQSKSIKNLFEELERGESKLTDNPALRVVDVVQVIIKQGGKVLVEKEQVLSDDRIRFRSLPPSEKLHGGETWQEAAIRCVEEELQLSSADVNVLTRQFVPISKKRKSDSYPGLDSNYNICIVEMAVPILPDEDFWTNEKCENGTGTVIGKHLWGWIDEDKLEIL